MVRLPFKMGPKRVLPRWNPVELLLAFQIPPESCRWLYLVRIIFAGLLFTEMKLLGWQRDSI